MSNSNRQNQKSPIGSLSSVSWPVVVGLALSAVFYILIHRGPLNHPQLHRFFTSHPVLYAEVILFFVGIASLVLKLIDVISQQNSLKVDLFEEPRPGGQPVADCDRLLEVWEQLAANVRGSYLGRRVHAVLEFVSRKGSAEGLDEELRVLADNDVNRQSESYSLVRIVIWATPMLGFLGTVVGITQSLGDLAQQDLGGNGLQSAMKGLLAGLYVAFDTTALALTLSMLLMFIQYGIEQVETGVLTGVDARLEAEMIGRFEQIGGGSDPNVASIHRMAQSVVKATELLVEKQAEIWQATLDASHRQWGQLLQLSGEQVRHSLAESLDTSLERLSVRLAESQESAASQARQQWHQWQEVLLENSRALLSLQTELHRQGESIHEVVQATGDVIKLETTLNDNLKLLAGSKNFEDTVMSLSAAIHLLNTRLQPAEVGRVEARQLDAKQTENRTTRGRAA